MSQRFNDLVAQFVNRSRQSISSLAKQTNLSPRTINNWKFGVTQRPHQWQSILKLATALNLTQAELDQLLAAAGYPFFAELQSQAPEEDRHLFTYWLQTGGTTSQSLNSEQQVTSIVSNLPAYPTTFIGRQQEMGEIQKRLLDPTIRLLTLTGPGGVGKTRLAIESVQPLTDYFRDGVYLVNLAPVSQPDMIAESIAKTIGIPQQQEQTAEAHLIKLLRARHLLLLLDNYEHLLDGGRLLISRLLQAAPHLMVLVTSRSPLEIYGEHLYRINPLSAVPVTTKRGMQVHSDPSEPVLSPAADLFVQRASAAQQTFICSKENITLINQICTRWDGLPLAIELVAGQLSYLSLHDLLPSLDMLLVDAPADFPDRHRSLDTAIAWSYHLLPPLTQHVFRHIALFADGARLETLYAVLDADPDKETDSKTSFSQKHDEGWHASLIRLRKNSLLRLEQDGADEPRYQMLQTIRTYGLRQLETAQEMIPARERQAHFYLRLLRYEASNIEVVDLPERQQLTVEHHNLVDLLRWSIQDKKTDIAAQLADHLGSFWHRAHRFQEGFFWLEQVMEMLQDAGTERQYIKGLLWLQRFANASASTNRYYPELQAALVTLESLIPQELESQEEADQTTMAQLLSALGNAASRMQDVENARRYTEQSLALWTKLNDNRQRAIQHHHLGVMARRLREYEQATFHFEQGLQIQKARDFERGMAYALNNLAIVAKEQGEYEKAIQFAQQALFHATRSNQLYLMGNAHITLGQIAYLQDDYSLAVEHMQQGIEHHHQLDYQLGVQDAQVGLIYAHTAGGDYTRAEFYAVEVLRKIDRAIDLFFFLPFLIAIADLFVQTDRYEPARPLLSYIAEHRQQLHESLPRHVESVWAALQPVMPDNSAQSIPTIQPPFVTQSDVRAYALHHLSNGT